MPARDIYRETVKRALIKEGWTITHDPLKLSWGGKDLFVDLGATQLIAAEKAERHIAVEIKSFVGDSEVADLEQALGQYLVYLAVMCEREPQRDLYLAVPHDVWLNVFDEPLGNLLLQTYPVQIVSFDVTTEEVVQWTS
jgi:hypothetical protein